MQLFSFFDLAALLIGVLILLIWLFFYITGKKYEDMFAQLDQKDFPMGDTYFLGYAVTLFLKLDYKNKQSRKLRKQLGVLYETKYTEYYLRVISSMQFTMTLTVAAFAAPLYFLSGSPILFFMLLGMAGFVYYYYGISMEKKVEDRAEEVLMDFSEVVSKLALLVNSGMIVGEAWERASKSGDRTLYQEMRRSVEEMHNGKSFADALFVFAQRSMLPEIKKFSSTLIQGVTQGNRELAAMLIAQSKEVWDMKRQIVRRKGAQANNKLLIPICMCFVGILIMIIVPIFANLGA